MEGSPCYWQTESYNGLCFTVNTNVLLSIAMNRFRWVGLPETCDPRFLEMQLHTTGIATICHDPDMPDIWQSLMALPQGTPNAYGVPTTWLARGMDQSEYKVTPKNGEIIYYSQTRTDPWGIILQYATKLTHIQRTVDLNLMHQQKPWVMVAPQEKRLELLNIFKQISGYEPAILGDQSLLALNEGNVFTLDLKVPFIGSELTELYQNTLNQFLLYMGVPHVMYEKSERMLSQEISTGNATTNIILKNCLDSRRWACDRLQKLSPSTFGDIGVYLNEDWESYTYNYINNLERQESAGKGGDNNELVEVQATTNP